MDSPQTSKNEPRPLMEDADPNGDVILLVGTEDPQSIRASSKILSLASPVFAAMLGPNFLEGSKLSTVQPYQLHLPEDDADAIVWLCLVLHYRREIDDRISFSLLEKLAFVCDKYDCARALSSWSKEWLLRFPPGQPNSEKVLYISYLFGAHESFWISSKGFLTDGLPSNSGAANRSDSPLGLALLPESLLE
ncbi:hypothetical protein MMC29_004004 [Sticta canariensis]|nr:hypothetical protein [Sticta canariensis]